MNIGQKTSLKNFVILFIRNNGAIIIFIFEPLPNYYYLFVLFVFCSITAIIYRRQFYTKKLNSAQEDKRLR